MFCWTEKNHVQRTFARLGRPENQTPQSPLGFPSDRLGYLPRPHGEFPGSLRDHWYGDLRSLEVEGKGSLSANELHKGSEILRQRSPNARHPCEGHEVEEAVREPRDTGDAVCA